MAKPSTDLLDELTKDTKSESKPSAKVTVTIEQEPDWKAMGQALLSAVKASDPQAAADAVRAICMCCGSEDEPDMDDVSDD